MEYGLKEGVCGKPGCGTKKEGKVPEAGHSLAEAVSMETAGLNSSAGQGKHDLREGGKLKSGGKVCLRSDKCHIAKVDKIRRT